MRLPITAYILLWFPKPSETFIFREVLTLWQLGLPLKVFTLYGPLRRHLSPEMATTSRRAQRLGLRHLRRVPFDLIHWYRRQPHQTRRLLTEIPSRRWRSLEKTGESWWAFLCGFHLARRFEAQGVEHIHAPWADGPATAAWVASRLTGIPFSFSARAADIHPPEQVLAQKIAQAAFVRSETKYNVTYLHRFAKGRTDKIHAVYNGLSLSQYTQAPVLMRPPYKLLAVGRFVPKKGFDVLLRAGQLLTQRGVNFELTLAGSGGWGGRLKRLARELDLENRVIFPGFVPHDRISGLMSRADILIVPSVIHASGDRDGIPTVIMEALLHRLPVVATDVAGINEVIQEGQTGRLIPQRDPTTLARAIISLIEDREEARRMADRGHDLVLDQFDPEKNCRRMIQLFRGQG